MNKKTLEISARSGSVRNPAKDRRNSIVTTTAVAIALMSVGATDAAAQDPNADETSARRGEVDTITVTARKREENLQTVPISMSAFSGDMLAARGANNVEEAARFAPNISIGSANSGSGGGSNSEIYVRGIGQNDFLITTDPGVGLYIDEVYVARSTGTILDFLDLERIEVLRGPQGTLFGRNTIGGAISLVSKKPSDEFGGDIRLMTGRYSQYSAKISLDVPLSDAVKTRHTFYYNNEDGYTDRINAGDRLGDEEVIAGRSMVQWEPSADFSALLAVDVSHKEGGSANNAVLQFDPLGGLAPLWQGLVGAPLGVAAPAIVNGDDPFTSSATGPNVDNHDIVGISGTLEWDVGPFAVKSITAYRSLEAEFGRDGDNSPVQYIQTDNTVDQEQVTQELQVTGDMFNGALDWLVGGYYFDENATDSNDVRLASGLYAALEGLPGPLIYLGGPPGTTCADFGTVSGVVCLGGAGNPVNAIFDLDFDIFNRIDTRSYAFFTHDSFELTDRFAISGGLRWVHEKKDYFLSHLRVNSGVPIVPPTNVSDEWNALLPKVSLDFQATDDIFAYASAARGFKSGGFNGRPTTTAEVGSFDPEFVWAYEIGMKTELFDRRAVFNIAGFYYDYKDIQLTIVSADSTGNLILVVENAGTARMIGAEAEFQARPTEFISFDGAVGYLDAEYRELNPGATIAATNRLVKTPKVTASLGVNIDMPISSRWTATLRGDWSYRGAHFNDAPNTPILRQEAVSLFNARLSLIDDVAGWNIAFFGTNLSNERYITSGLSALTSFGTVEGVFASPRRWGVSVEKSF